MIGRLGVVGGGDQLIHALLRRASLAQFSSVQFSSVVSRAAPASLMFFVSSSVVHKCKSDEAECSTLELFAQCRVTMMT